MTRKAQAQDLLDWYDCHRRHLPWRSLPGETADPYAVWLSEIMLQQTTVAAVKPYYESFLARWPTVASLAQAKLDDVLTEWAGLGYYARARNLHACAQTVVHEHDGNFPDDIELLLALPGIGAYTAAAISAIAFETHATVVDGNVERVMARLFGVKEPLPKAKAELKQLAAKLTPSVRPGDYAQAVMDLGATVCTPKSPACILCPWVKSCVAHKLGIVADLPRRAPKKAKPMRRGVCFWLTRPDGAILLRRRPEKGLLGGMMEIPSTPWQGCQWGTQDAHAFSPAAVTNSKWQSLPGAVTHTFTHFHLELSVEAAPVTTRWANRAANQDDLTWVHLEAMADQALPSVMRKVVKHAVKVGY